MKRILWPFFLLTAIVLGPFQNCAIYQNDARKNFEKGVQSTDNSSTESSCNPYLTTAEARLAFEDERAVAQIVNNPEFSIEECLVAISAETTEPEDVATCTMTENNAEDARNMKTIGGEIIAVFTDSFSEAGMDSYGYVKQSGAKTTVIAVAARVGAALGARCGVSFDTLADYTAGADTTARRRVLKTIHQMLN